MNIFIGGAWPYANGSLHLGHLAALLPGDILARYYRLKGDKVLYISGSDCHGTPIAIRAAQEGISAKSIAEKYHKEFSECFERLGFSYDLYGKTYDEFHHKEVKEIFKTLYEKGFIYEKEVEQTYCESCNKFLPDRYVEGICPHCGNIARGDQCDFCSSLLDPIDLIDKKCKICGSSPIIKKTKHFFFALSKLQKELQEYVQTSKGWRENAVNLATRYLKEGLKDRAATRDLEWGIDVPISGYEDKKIYVWIEAVCGYLSASKKWGEDKKGNWKEFWKSDNVLAYYVHGKDNIPFHTLILPALLIGIGEKKLPDRIISSEYLTIEGKKISTSRNWTIDVGYIIKNYNIDAIRYFLTINGPEKRDTDFSWREFINSNNGELLGAYGNFVNRTIVFINKYFENKIPRGSIEKGIYDDINKLYVETGDKIEAAEFKGALEEIFEFIRKANKYFDKEQPWITINADKEKCKNTLFNCIQIIANLSNLLAPFTPFSSEKIRSILNLEKNEWNYIEVGEGSLINKAEILFERIDKKKIDEEVQKMKIK